MKRHSFFIILFFLISVLVFIVLDEKGLIHLLHIRIGLHHSQTHDHIIPCFVDVNCDGVRCAKNR